MNQNDILQKFSAGTIIELEENKIILVKSIRKMGRRFVLSYTSLNDEQLKENIFSQDELTPLKIIAKENSFDFTGNPTHFKLFAEAQRIKSAYLFDPLFAVNCCIVEPLPHQVEAVYKYMLTLPNIRFLLADDTGAGKTIMTGLLIKELLMRERIERILIITPGGLTKQWQEDEMMLKFNIPFSIIDRNSLNNNMTIFQTEAKCITSIDFIARKEVLNIATQNHWDLIVFDEAHKLSAYDYGQKQYLSKRYEAAAALSTCCEHLLLLTATPHRGRNDTFTRLMQILDKDIFATKQLTTEQISQNKGKENNRFFLRRLKEDMKGWDAKPLFKNRFTKTVTYPLTAKEKKLYDAVTDYLIRKKEEAEKNVHVSLVLTIMQRRLTSSISAIKNTLEKRWKTLDSIKQLVQKMPKLWKQRKNLQDFNIHKLIDMEDLTEEEQERLETIWNNPKNFKLFTTAKNTEAIVAEAEEVKKLFEMAKELQESQQNEKKFEELEKLLISANVIEGEKLVIFTEHKDTLLYLEQKLRQSGGYTVVTIHGGKSMNDRRKVQAAFAKDAQILIGTDAAGEGINLQFCRLLINWDIPWNPNRLEQRMGRIHRYGQQQDVLVYNLVATNTREGSVLERLLTKLEIMRESIGSDRVYDVIQDVLENVSLESIMNSVLNGQETDLDTQFLNKDNKELENIFKEKIKQQTHSIANHRINYKTANELSEKSNETRLQPIYIKNFFEKAFPRLEGSYTLLRNNIYEIEQLPKELLLYLKQQHRHIVNLPLYCCFDKKDFLKHQQNKTYENIQYMSPGNKIFDALIEVVLNTYRKDMMKGTILVSAEALQPHYTFVIKSQIKNQQSNGKNENIAAESLHIISQYKNNEFTKNSVTKLLDLQAPSFYAKKIAPQTPINKNEIEVWAYENITEPQLQQTQTKINKEISQRKQYIENAFKQQLLQKSNDIAKISYKAFQDQKAREELHKITLQKENLSQKRNERLAMLSQKAKLLSMPPQMLGGAYIVPLSDVEYKKHYGMKRDEEAEKIAMQVAILYEQNNNRKPIDVSANNVGYDIKSTDKYDFKRYIEVKGRVSNTTQVMLSENEFNILSQLGEIGWLYIVANCKTKPKLYCIQNPTNKLSFDQKSKGIQYLLQKQNLEDYTVSDL